MCVCESGHTRTQCSPLKSPLHRFWVRSSCLDLPCCWLLFTFTLTPFFSAIDPKKQDCVMTNHGMTTIMTNPRAGGRSAPSFTRHACKMQRLTQCGARLLDLLEFGGVVQMDFHFLLHIKHAVEVNEIASKSARERASKRGASGARAQEVWCERQSVRAVVTTLPSLFLISLISLISDTSR